MKLFLCLLVGRIGAGYHPARCHRRLAPHRRFQARAGRPTGLDRTRPEGIGGRRLPERQREVPSHPLPPAGYHRFSVRLRLAPSLQFRSFQSRRTGRRDTHRPPRRTWQLSAAIRELHALDRGVGPVTGTLKKVDHTSLPTLYLPSKNLVPNSERYIIGPVGAAEIRPAIPPSVAGSTWAPRPNWGFSTAPRATTRAGFQLSDLGDRSPTCWRNSRKYRCHGQKIRPSGCCNSWLRPTPTWRPACSAQIAYKADVTFRSTSPPQATTSAI